MGNSLKGVFIIMKRLDGYSIIVVLILVEIFYVYQTEKSHSATFNVPGDFATIQEAIDDPGTVNGDIITVLAGIHIENNIHITKELTVEGQGIGVTILDPSSLGGNVVQFYPDADNVIIQDMTIQNAFQAIRFEMAGQTINNTDIIRVSMEDNTSRAIEIHNETTVTNLFIDESNFENTVQGIRLSSSSHLSGGFIDDSTFTSNDIGIYVANDGGTSTFSSFGIRRNTFTDHTQAYGSQGTAIFLEEGQTINITDNTFENNRRDIQLFKWYQPSVAMSDIRVLRNYLTGTTDAVFSLFNADTGSGQTTFSNIGFNDNYVQSNDASYVYAGAHNSGPPSAGGTGWNTVRILGNCFMGTTTAGKGVRFYLPSGIVPSQALGGASINVSQDWWGTTNLASIAALLPEPSITNVTPIRSACPVPPPSSPFTLEPITQPTAGVVNSLSVSGATPDSNVQFLYGFSEGVEDGSSICSNLEVGIEEFTLLDMQLTDQQGESGFNLYIPSDFVYDSLFIQAVDMNTCTASNVVKEIFLDPVEGVFLLTPPDPGVAGVTNTLSTGAGTPNGDVAYIWEFVEQTVPADFICPGFNSGILRPRRLTIQTADDEGNSTLVVNVPPRVAGRTVKIQAIDLSTCIGSDVVTETF